MRQRSEQNVQHDPAVPDDIDAFQGFMAGPGSGMVCRNVFKAFGQGDFVLVHSQVFLSRELAVFDVFPYRRRQDREHWDAMEPLPEGSQPNSGKA